MTERKFTGWVDNQLVTKFQAGLETPSQAYQTFKKLQKRFGEEKKYKTSFETIKIVIDNSLKDNEFYLV